MTAWNTCSAVVCGTFVAVIVILFLDKQNIVDRYEAKMEACACIIPVSRFFLAKPFRNMPSYHEHYRRLHSCVVDVLTRLPPSEMFLSRADVRQLANWDIEELLVSSSRLLLSRSCVEDPGVTRISPRKTTIWRGAADEADLQRVDGMTEQTFSCPAVLRYLP
jgi:hypothetical protein